MKKLTRSLLALAALGVVAGAQAITFSTFNFAGSTPELIGTQGNGYDIFAYPKDIDFSFHNAYVGDGILNNASQPLRLGVITFTFFATADAGELISEVRLVANTIAVGSGFVQVSEIVEDMGANPGGNKIMTLDTTNGDGPLSSKVVLDKPTTKLKIKKTIDLVALTDTQGLDLAGIGLVEQRFTTVVPEPATMAALALGLAGVASRRRRKA
jgi:hypothetical protein